MATATRPHESLAQRAARLRDEKRDEKSKREAATRENALLTYCDLLRRYDAPNDVDEQELLDVMEILGIDERTVESDVALIREVESIRPLHDDRENAAAAYEKAEQAIRDYEEKLTAARAELEKVNRPYLKTKTAAQRARQLVQGDSPTQHGSGPNRSALFVDDETGFPTLRS